MDQQFSNQILPWIGRIERHFSILMRDALAPIGVTYAEFRLVGLLFEEAQGVPQKVLAARLGLDASGISVTLKALEKKGIVVRERDKDDARILRVKCTPKAYEMKQVIEAFSAQELVAVEGLSSDDVKVLLGLLKRVSGNLGRKTGVE
ncbi:MarR family winged helix-turn-helix transcriptional regulator [Hirschia litorea]|uniref:MarR family winged helix-turn-helix transcriptional regulator n=1 Tax=Hirschia litorea TaxID=1199156 RepID=A0ABW2IGN7_9PROT